MWHDHPFRQKNRVTERTVGMVVGGGWILSPLFIKEGGWGAGWTFQFLLFIHVFYDVIEKFIIVAMVTIKRFP